MSSGAVEAVIRRDGLYLYAAGREAMGPFETIATICMLDQGRCAFEASKVPHLSLTLPAVGLLSSPVAA